MRPNRPRTSLALVMVAVLAGCAGSASPSPSAATLSAPPSAATLSAPPEASTTPGSSASQSGAPTEITFQADPDAGRPVAWWQGLVDKFNSENPGIHVKFIPSPGATQRDQFAKTLLEAGTFPDVAFSLSVNLFKDNLLPFDQSDPIIQQQMNIDTMTWGGQLLNLGPYFTATSLIFYNKSMFATAGITATPTTWPEFEVDLQKLKAAGFVPLLLGGEFLPAFDLADPLSNIFSETDPCWYGQRAAGKVHFTDQLWVDQATKLQAWSKKGYFTPGGLGNGYAASSAAFIAGKAAMYPMGVFETGNFKTNPPKDFEIGVFPTPTTDGLLHLDGQQGGAGFTVSKTTAHPAAAVKFAEWLSFSPEFLDALLAVTGESPMVKLINGTVKPNYTPLQQAVADMVAKASVAPNTTRIWYFGQGDKCAAAPGLPDEIAKVGGAIILGGDIHTNLAKLDAFWDANFKPQ